MKLTVFNGSPKGKESATKLLVDLFLAGFESLDGNRSELFYLNRIGKVEQFRQAFSEAEAVLLAFPLYTDAMPAIVKAFIETLEPLCGSERNTLICFLVQSGFPEAIHSRYVERYLEKLADRLGCTYAGTIIKGSGGGVRSMPAPKKRQLFTTFHQVGESFGRTKKFDRALLAKLAGPEPSLKWLATLIKWKHLPFVNFLYWDNQLRKNGGYKRRFARPYAE